MYPDERKEYIAAIEAWENLPLPEKIKTPKPVIHPSKTNDGGNYGGL